MDLSEENIIFIWNKKNSFKVLPERWWILTSLVLNWKEILFQEMLAETLFDFTKSVRWWIPFMFPNAWPWSLNETEKFWFELPQHWIARTNSWQVLESGENFLELKFDNFMQIWNYKFPFEFEIFMKYLLTDDSLKISLKIFNNWKKDFFISHGFHPYFLVPAWKKSEIIWQENISENIVKNSEIWQNDWTISLDFPKDWLNFEIKNIWKITLKTSSEFKKFWIWSMKDKNFVCVEPVVWNEWNISKNPITIKSWDSFESFFEIKLN